ncbi:ABC transporter permease [Flavobacterium granuli]|uniref:Lipoprotein-releasing system permease protein n=1 Tax=Flavobacterium granuli TaxID=280093 RepID=A0A1M5TYS4_9FLAO|nr:FtsX-like permease family protein [Flavobacterium granuli]PRZ22899.1 lipoprotein-releasing system permease protein [Flavobacterium granuli]SHH55533.1 lipoprotein-releasing system permease protein [Flavobacterium granuli]
MNFKLILNIAFHLLKARLKQTIVAAVGVTFGIAMFITLISFMGGLNEMLDGLMLNRTPHILLYNEVKPSENQPLSLSEEYKNHTKFIHSIKPKDRGKSVYNSQSIIKVLKQDKRIIDVAPKVTASVLFNSGTIEISGFVNGIDMLAEDKLFKISDYITEGKIADLAQNNSVIIGIGLANKMLLSKGDIIKITTSNGDLTPLKIVGISEIGIAEIDNVMSYTSLATAQKILGQPKSYITDIQVNLYDKESAVELAKEFRKEFNIDTIDYQTANAQFETGSTVRSIISYSVGIVLLIVAGFGIYNILNMMIYEKMDSIAILKATGFSGSDVKWIFISLSIIIGLTGGIFGLLFGFIFSNIIDVIPFETTSLPTVKTYPIVYNIIYYIIGIVFAFCTTIIAGLFPALKASKVDPVEIIRGK